MTISVSTKKSLSEIAAAYKENASASAKYNRILIYGGTGAGKTYSLKTFRLPLWIDSFDPGGSVCLADYEAEGKALVRSTYEEDNWDRPSAFESWDRAFTKDVSSGIFSQIGTYCLDSATTWAQAAMNAVLAKRGVAGTVPHQQDWYPQMILLEKSLRRIMFLPCDVVFICHDDAVKDDLTGSLSRLPLLTGKLSKRIPLLFSEIYFAHVRRTAKGVDYLWQTVADSQTAARSRNAAKAKIKIEVNEPANFKELAKKWGGLDADLPLITKEN